MEDDEVFESLFAEQTGQILEDVPTFASHESASSENSIILAAASLDFVDSDDEMLEDENNMALGPHLMNLSERGSPESFNTIQHRGFEFSSFDEPETALFNKAPFSLTSLANRTCVDDDDSIMHSTTISSDHPVIEKIEVIFQSIRADLEQGKAIGVALCRRRKHHRKEDSVGSSAKRICFPGRSPEEAWRFTVVVRLLELIREAISTGVVLSKRDIYYRDPALFGSQKRVDRYVDEIALTFGVARSALNVTAVAKGLIAGAITINRRDGSKADASTDREGMLVPNLNDVVSVKLSSVQWILVVEKEASFRSLAASLLWPLLATEGILLTGKGYPDIATRAMLRFLSVPSPRNGFAAPPVLGLADFDPDGLAIMSTYRDGSLNLAHENYELCVPTLRHIGLSSEHMSLAAEDDRAAQAVLTLTMRDRHKARKMLERNDDSADCARITEHYYGQRKELRRMLMLNVKAELQLLDAVPGATAAVLEQLPRATF